MSGNGREAILDFREWSDGFPGCPGVVGWPSRMSGNGRKALPDVQEWLRNLPRCTGNPSGCLGVVGSPS